ncbi:shikimate dehydrogenase family protein [Bradyrhizobium sp.]|uniref:shikimate dehydrogenase family protein n=1 Tax=Bradyrhizobium sp. TaxID=376 RepID=UPI0039E46C1F
MNVKPVITPATTVDFVNGRTRVYAIIGHPIEQVRSPEAITYELRRRGLNAILLPFDVSPQAFDELFSQLLAVENLDGLIITVPHKVRARELCTRVGPLAEISGSASVIARTADSKWVGELFDGMGCIAAIRNRGVTFDRKRVLLLGVGGAGAGIAVEIARQAPAEIHIHDPDGEKAARVMARLSPRFPAQRFSVGMPSLDGVDILINASPVGMLDPTRTPIEASHFPPHLVVMDVITDPAPTRLLRTAEESGCIAVYGREMFDSQIAGACDFLLNTRKIAAADVRFDHALPPVSRCG